MIRRWSYLNHLNTVFYDSFQILDVVQHFKAFKMTTSYRKDLYHTPTKWSRKSTSRRKHSHNWLLYHNILTEWSKEYLFFRKYNRFIVSLNIFKNSYLVYNLLIFKNALPSDIVGGENIIITNIIKRVIKYSHRFKASLSAYLTSYNASYWLYATSLYNLEDIQKLAEPTMITPYLPYQGIFYTENLILTETVWLKVLINNVMLFSLLKLITFYKVSSLLIASRVLIHS